MDTFGIRFKNLRLQKGYTQDQLIKEFNEKFHYNLTKSAISQYENDKRIPETNLLINLASYFQVSTDYLLCAEDTIYEKKSEYYSNNKYIDLKQLMDKIIYLAKTDSITLNGNVISSKTKELFINCMEIALELSKKKRKYKKIIFYKG